MNYNLTDQINHNKSAFFFKSSIWYENGQIDHFLRQLRQVWMFMLNNSIASASSLIKQREITQKALLEYSEAHSLQRETEFFLTITSKHLAF